MIGFGDNNNQKKINKIPVDPSIEEIIDYAINLQLKGNLEEAIKCYKYCINKGINDPRVFCNYGLIFLKLGDLLAQFNDELNLVKPLQGDLKISLKKIDFKTILYT